MPLAASVLLVCMRSWGALLGSGGAREQARAAALAPSLARLRGAHRAHGLCWVFPLPHYYFYGGLLPGENKMPFRYSSCLC